MEPVPSGIVGLDRILMGGLMPRALHAIGGLPGTGKTAIAQQISYNHARAGGKVLYLSALSETSERLVEHAASFEFFDPRFVASQVYYVSVYGKLEEGGLPAVLEEVRRLSLEHQATLVCLDGLATLKSAASTPLDFRRFVFDLNTQLRSLGVTSLTLGPWAESEAADPEFMVADGIITLTLQSIDQGASRLVEVLKLRGARFIPGRHSFSITPQGVLVFPNLESTLDAEGIAQPSGSWTRVRTGSPSLDEMLGGGIPSGSITLVAGVPGAGKTVLGLSFLAEGGKQREPGIYMGRSEPPSRLLPKAEGLGLDLTGAVQEGKDVMYWSPSAGISPDQAAWHILGLLDETGAKRLVIDDINGVLIRLEPMGRARSFLIALMNALRARNVTALVMHELARLSSPDLDTIYERIGAAVDNVVMLQYVERAGEYRRLISILKVRESDFDRSFREFTIGKGGLIVGEKAGTQRSGTARLGHRRGRPSQ